MNFKLLFVRFLHCFTGFRDFMITDCTYGFRLQSIPDSIVTFSKPLEKCASLKYANLVFYCTVKKYIFTDR